MEYPNISIYNSNNISSIFDPNNMQENETYFLEKKQVYFGIERYIKNVVDYHLIRHFVAEHRIPDNLFVEFGLYNNSNMSIEYDKKNKKNPLLSIMSVSGEITCPIIFTNIDMDTYKYKEYTDDNNITVILPQNNTHILFDGSKYYGVLKSRYLKINIWNIIRPDAKTYEDNCTTNNLFDLSLSIVTNDHVQCFITDNLLIENILYNMNGNNAIFEKINEVLSTCTGPYVNINVKSFNSVNFSLTILENKYGKVAKDLFPFLNTSIDLEEDNRFHLNKLIQNILSKDVCYWIINECEKQNKWSPSPYKNYKDYLNIETFPAIMNFVLYISGMWLAEIRKLYNIDNININIRDIFIAKYSKNVNTNFAIRNKDDTFLTANLQLNSDIDFRGGEINIDGNSLIIKQGDMFVYNGKKMRTSGMVSDGVKYMLVIFTEIAF